METPGCWNLPTAGRHKFKVMREVLKHAEHDRAYKGDCDIRGDNAQSADQSHEKTSLVHIAARGNAEANKRFPGEKVSAAVARGVHAAEKRRQRG